MANRKSYTNLGNWRDKLSSIWSSPVHYSESAHKETQDTELESVEDWLLVQMDPSAQNGDGTPGTKKKSISSKSSSHLGPRSSSVSGSKNPRSTGSSSLQRSASNRGRKPINLEVVQNGRPQRSASPNRYAQRTTSPSRSVSGPGRTSSPSRNSVPKKSSMSQSRSASSPVNPPSQSHTHQNGTKSKDVDDSSLGSKIRDTLRISRPKKKKGAKGKGLAYSITPVEINLNASSKYSDPFETSYAEHTDSKSGQDHDFKAVSIPHNKPEYCDHCGETAWGLYRQVLKCSRCDFIVHRKCETKVVIDCSSRLKEVLSHDKQVEDLEIMEKQVENKEREATPPLQEVVLRNHTSHHSATNENTHNDSNTSSSNLSSTSSSQLSSPQQLLMEKTKLSRKIREYNRKTTPVHHIHLRSSHNDPSLIEYQGFVRVHMCVQRPIHVSTAITRTSWYRLMRPVKERTTSSVDGMPDGFETAFYLPTDTNRLVHIINTTTTKELVSILLKKFCVTDNPKKFSLYEEYGSDCRRLFEEDHPLEIVLDASGSHRNSKLVLRDNTYSTIQWDAFTLPELTNFIQILQREEEIYHKKLEARFATWRKCISQAQKDLCMQDITQKTKENIASSKTNPLTSRKVPPDSGSPRPKRKLPPTPPPKVGSVV